MRSVPNGITYRYCFVPFLVFLFVIVVPIALVIIVKVFLAI